MSSIWQSNTDVGALVMVGTNDPSSMGGSGTMPVSGLPLMVGDSGSGGTAGVVPAPTVGAASKFLRGDGTWQAVSGSGTVTTFSSGNLSPIFTASVATATTTPALTFSLSTATAHAFLGNNTGSTAAPAYVQPAFTDLSGTATTAQIPSLDTSKITTGTLALARGGLNLDLTGTGGASQVVKQTSLGGAITVAQLAFTDISGVVSAVQQSITLVDLTAQVATLTAQTLLASGSVVTGMYRLSGYIKKTTAATTSSTTGPLTLTYTDGTDSTSLTPTMALLTSAGAIATSNATNSATVTGMNTIVPFTFFAKTGAAITYTLTYASSGATAMVYEVHLRLEFLG